MRDAQVLEFAELQRKQKGYAKGSKQARALWYSTVFGAGSLVAVALAVLLQVRWEEQGENEGEGEGGKAGMRPWV